MFLFSSSGLCDMSASISIKQLISFLIFNNFLKPKIIADPLPSFFPLLKYLTFLKLWLFNNFLVF